MSRDMCVYSSAIVRQLAPYARMVPLENGKHEFTAAPESKRLWRRAKPQPNQEQWKSLFRTAALMLCKHVP